MFHNAFGKKSISQKLHCTIEKKSISWEMVRTMEIQIQTNTGRVKGLKATSKGHLMKLFYDCKFFFNLNVFFPILFVEVHKYWILVIRGQSKSKFWYKSSTETLRDNWSSFFTIVSFHLTSSLLLGFFFLLMNYIRKKDSNLYHNQGWNGVVSLNHFFNIFFDSDSQKVVFFHACTSLERL